MVNMPTHRFGSLIDDAYIRETLIVGVSTNSTVKNIYFQDHDTVRTIAERSKIQYDQVTKGNEKIF